MAKFKIGQEVELVNDTEKKHFLHIIEIQEITCSAGTQVTYTGRLWMLKEYGDEKYCHKDHWKAHEFELAAIPKKKKKKK